MSHLVLEFNMCLMFTKIDANFVSIQSITSNSSISRFILKIIYSFSDEEHQPFNVLHLHFRHAESFLPENCRFENSYRFMFFST